MLGDGSPYFLSCRHLLTVPHTPQVAEIFREEIGMFTYSQETRTFFFNPCSLESGLEFQLVGQGLLCGLLDEGSRCITSVADDQCMEAPI